MIKTMCLLPQITGKSKEILGMSPRSPMMAPKVTEILKTIHFHFSF